MTREDVAFHACAALTVAALAALYLLRSPGSVLVRWLDRRIDRALAAQLAGGLS